MTHAGPVSAFAEADYCYGTGPLTLRIIRVDWSTPVWYDGDEWFQVHGIELDRDGAERVPRDVLVRGRRLPPSLRQRR